MSVILLDDKKVTKYISLGIVEILDNPELAKQFCEVIQNRQLYCHCIDTARYAVQIGLVLDKNIELVELAKAGLLHDLGKIDIPLEILNKPGKLNDYEFGIMKTHSQLGYNKLVSFGVAKTVQDAALHHHEKLTGDGYPDGITDINMLTQIITVSDIFSALTELRSYKPPTTPSEAFGIMRGSMKGLNEDLIKVLESKVFSEIDDYKARELAALYRDNFRKYGRIVPESGDVVYLLGDEGVA